MASKALRSPRKRALRFGFPRASAERGPGSANLRILAVGFPWNSLDSLDRNELFKGLCANPGPTLFIMRPLPAQKAASRPRLRRSPCASFVARMKGSYREFCFSAIEKRRGHRGEKRPTWFVPTERRQCANTGRSPMAWGTGHIDPFLTFGQRPLSVFQACRRHSKTLTTALAQPVTTLSLTIHCGLR